MQLAKADRLACGVEDQCRVVAPTLGGPPDEARQVVHLSDLRRVHVVSFAQPEIRVEGCRDQLPCGAHAARMRVALLDISARRVVSLRETASHSATTRAIGITG